MMFDEKRSSASYSEGNFGRNQVLDSWISFSPLVPTIDLHIRITTDFHQAFS